MQSTDDQPQLSLTIPDDSEQLIYNLFQRHQHPATLLQSASSVVCRSALVKAMNRLIEQRERNDMLLSNTRPVNRQRWGWEGMQWARITRSEYLAAGEGPAYEREEGIEQLELTEARKLLHNTIAELKTLTCVNETIEELLRFGACAHMV